MNFVRQLFCKIFTKTNQADVPYCILSYFSNTSFLFSREKSTPRKFVMKGRDRSRNLKIRQRVLRKSVPQIGCRVLFRTRECPVGAIAKFLHGNSYKNFNCSLFSFLGKDWKHVCHYIISTCLEYLIQQLLMTLLVFCISVALTLFIIRSLLSRALYHLFVQSVALEDFHPGMTRMKKEKIKAVEHVTHGWGTTHFAKGWRDVHYENLIQPFFFTPLYPLYFLFWFLRQKRA